MKKHPGKSSPELPGAFQRNPYVVPPSPNAVPLAVRLADAAQAAEDANEFLRSEGAIRAYQRQLQNYANEIIDTQPQEAEKREYLYMKSWALQDVVRDLVTAIRTHAMLLDQQKKLQEQANRRGPPAEDSVAAENPE